MTTHAPQSADACARAEANAAWISALSAGDAGAIVRLRALLEKRLPSLLGRAGALGAADVDDVVQDATLRILSSLGTFRGDARFETWATTIALRVAMTALRRRACSRAHARAVLERARSPSLETSAPERRSRRDEILGVLRHAIAHSLSERQRQAIVAEMEGIPLAVIAEEMGSTTNALYKLTHDARRKLRSALEIAGFEGDSVRDVLAGASEPMP